MDARDRRAGLIIFGILQIILGLLCAAAVLVVAAGEEIARRAFPTAADSPSALASALIVYGSGAAYFMTVGIGSIRCRRWSRALSVVVSALWMVAGVVAGLMIAAIVPKFPVRPVLMIVAIAVPVIIHLFYRREDVRLTVERLDPKARWTDRVPLPILAVILVLAFGAVAMIANLANPVLMLFGRPSQSCENVT